MLTPQLPLQVAIKLKKVQLNFPQSQKKMWKKKLKNQPQNQIISKVKIKITLLKIKKNLHYHFLMKISRQQKTHF